MIKNKIVLIVVIAILFILDIGIIEFFISKNLLSEADFPEYFTLVNYSITNNTLFVTGGGYFGFFSITYFLSKVFLLTVIQSMQITIGIYIILNILSLYFILKIIYKNSLLVLIGILIFFNFTMSSVSYALRGYIGMLSAQFFILISIYNIYKIIDGSKFFINMFGICFGVFMGLSTHPGIGVLNCMFIILILCYLIFIKKYKFPPLFYISLLISITIPVIVYWCSYITIFRYYGMPIINHTPKLFILLAVFSAIIFVISTVFKKLKIRVILSDSLHLYFYISLTVLALLLANKVTLPRTEYFLLFVISILLLFPFKLIKAINIISIKNYNLVISDRLRHKLFMLLLIFTLVIVLPRVVIARFIGRYMPNQVTNFDQIEAALWINKNIPIPSSIKVMNYSELPIETIRRYTSILSRMTFLPTSMYDPKQRYTEHHFQFIEPQLVPKNIEELRSFIAVSKHIVDLYGKNIYDYKVFPWNQLSFNYLFLVGTPPEEVNKHFNSHLSVVYKNNTITIFEYGKHAKEDPILRKNFYFNAQNNLIKDASLMWQENSINAVISVRSSDSQGCLEYSIPEYKKYRDKILTLWALVKRYNPCTTYISLDDGISLANSKSSNFALEYFDFLSITKKIDKNAKYIKVKLNLDAVNSKVDFYDVTLIER